MDVSEKYMEMCLMADKDLRPLYKFKKGDWIFSPADSPPFMPKVLSDYGIVVSNDYGVVTFAFPRNFIPTFIYNENEPLPTIDVKIDKVDFYRIPEYMWYRLHRQDQLQSMVSNDRTAISLACRFKDFIIRPFFDKSAPYIYESEPQESMEQLWLKFVMYDRFYKVWTGKVWKAIE